jgi:predicted TIM-barrel fold metal-dependent hydrolase
MPALDKIDVHHHALLPAVVGPSPFGNSADIPEWSVERSLDTMDRTGTRTALLSLTAPGVPFTDPARAITIATEVNQLLAGIIERDPSRFGAFATLPLPDVDSALAELHHAIDVLGLDGIGLMSHYGGHYLGDPLFEPLWAAIEERGTPVHIHPVSPASNQDLFDLPPSLFEFTFDTTRSIVQMLFNGTLTRHPDLKIIVSHAGGTLPYLAQRLTYGAEIQSALRDRQPPDVIGLLRRLYYDTAVSGNPYSLAALTELVDTDHILFGSDFPYLSQQIIDDNADGVFSHEALAGEQAAHAVARGNARTLFPRLR